MAWKYPIVCNSNSKFYVESKCWASKHKHTEYTQNIMLCRNQMLLMKWKGKKRCDGSTACNVCFLYTMSCWNKWWSMLACFALLILLQHHAPESSSPAASPPGSDSVTSGKKLWEPWNEMLDQRPSQGSNWGQVQNDLKNIEKTGFPNFYTD